MSGDVLDGQLAYWRDELAHAPVLDLRPAASGGSFLRGCGAGVQRAGADD
ncbi:hypothetical protein [Streptomyces qaidamensis]|nr:hypothetical protein [Streptomyces qaidamensis]